MIIYADMSCHNLIICIVCVLFFPFPSPSPDSFCLVLALSAPAQWNRRIFSPTLQYFLIMMTELFGWNTEKFFSSHFHLTSFIPPFSPCTSQSRQQMQYIFNRKSFSIKLIFQLQHTRGWNFFSPIHSLSSFSATASAESFFPLFFLKNISLIKWASSELVPGEWFFLIANKKTRRINGSVIGNCMGKFYFSLSNCEWEKVSQQRKLIYGEFTFFV